MNSGPSGVGKDFLIRPFAGGEPIGEALVPIYPSVPEAALKDKKLYELLALLEADRAGKARERTANIGNEIEVVVSGLGDLSKERIVEIMMTQRPK